MVVAALIAAFIAVFTNVQAQRATNTQLRIAEQGQITSRYNAAVTNLGSRSIDVRLGGIYALQRLMKDSPPDQPTVIAVLCAFVRDQALPAGQSPKGPIRPLRTDIQASLTVVGTRNTAKDGRATVVDFDHAQLATAQLSSLRLSSANFLEADLPGADLREADLSSAYLGRADLRGADLRGADLRSAFLFRADLRSAYLFRADLRGANLSSADLRSAFLFRADLRGADLGRADLRSAILFSADLRGANLGRADLRGALLGGADLGGADLREAKWPKSLPAPSGWVRDPHSGRLKRARA